MTKSTTISPFSSTSKYFFSIIEIKYTFTRASLDLFDILNI